MGRVGGLCVGAGEVTGPRFRGINLQPCLPILRQKTDCVMVTESFLCVGASLFLKAPQGQLFTD